LSKPQSIAVEVRPVADLVPYERNARKHPADKVRKLAEIIREFGWTAPILADEAGIVAGHRRRLAAMLIYGEGGTIRLPGGQELPPGTVPVVDCTGWSDAQRRAYILADNQTTLEGEWDDDLLRLELTFLEGAGFDMALTGFDAEALEAALGAAGNGDDPSEPDPLKVKLSDRFGVPPFSVLNAREGWWQDRKRAWLALGIKSELGRGEGVDGGASPGGSPRPLDRMKNAKAHAIKAGALGDRSGNDKGLTSAIADRARRRANATPGGSALPAANYGKTKARGDGRGRAIDNAEG